MVTTQTASTLQGIADAWDRRAGAPVIPGNGQGLVVNAKSNTIANLAGNGTINDQPGLAKLVNALGAAYVADGIPRVIHAPAGTYSLQDHGTVWKSGVSLVGDGAGITRFLLSNPGDATNPTPLATYVTAQGASTSAPLVDCTFADFEIDGSGVTTSSYNTGAKGLVLQYMMRARFLNLYIHDTAASGLGCDFLQDSIIDGVVSIGCGRQNDGTQPGGAGIGIGVGGWGTVERTTIVNCTAVANGTHGIFVELQNNAWTRPKGIRIIGCHAGQNRHGISDWGAEGLLISGCTILGNLIDGVGVAASGVGQTAGQGGRITGCTIADGAADGIRLADTNRYTVCGNRISGNGGYGIHHSNIVTSAATSALEETYSDNDIYGNGLDGIRVDTPLSDPFILNNRIRNNGQQSAGSSTGTGGTVTYGPLAVTDTGAAWVIGSQIGKIVTVGAQTAIVASNTATVLTLFPTKPKGTTAWVTSTPADGTGYSLPAAPTNRAGLCFNATVAHPNVRGNRIWDNQGTKVQTYGWWITATGTCTSGQVTDNDLTANLSGSFLFATAPSGGTWGTNAGMSNGSVTGATANLLDGPLSFNPVTTATAPGAGAGGALPATPQGYATVAIAGTSRQIPYY